MKGLKIEEVATRIDVSTQTLNRWYKFKKENPRHELSKLLPAYGKAKTIRGWARVWKPEDVWKLAQVKLTIKTGRTGQMGKYEGRGTKNGKDENSRA